VGAAPLRRLTRSEYDRTVRDLLGDGTRPARGFQPDEKIGAFDHNANAAVSEAALERYASAAESLAAAAVPRLAALLPCSSAVTAATEAECARRFVVDFGRRAYRRPLSADEIGRYEGLVKSARAGATFADGIRVALAAMLQSPHFLYHVEVGAPPAPGADTAPLTSHELASRLAYLFSGTAPDAELARRADAGGLTTIEEIEREARRLLAGPAAGEVIGEFHVQWMELDRLEGTQKDARLFPVFTPALREAMRAETARFSAHVVREGEGTLATLGAQHREADLAAGAQVGPDEQHVVAVGRHRAVALPRFAVGHPVIHAPGAPASRESAYR
jgi:hypothetical protein